MNFATHARLAALAGMALGTAANASTLTPTDTHFTLRGHVQIPLSGRDAKCVVTMRGLTDTDGVGRIKSFEMSGADAACAATPIGLPWKVKGYGPRAASIAGFGYEDTVANCSPGGNILVEVASTGVWSWVGGDCFFGNLRTTPPITVTTSAKSR